jgi:hypothetical protein
LKTQPEKLEEGINLISKGTTYILAEYNRPITSKEVSDSVNYVEQKLRGWYTTFDYA